MNPPCKECGNDPCRCNDEIEGDVVIHNPPPDEDE